MLSEISRIEKDKIPFDFICMWNLKKNQSETDPQRTSRWLPKGRRMEGWLKK